MLRIIPFIIALVCALACIATPAPATTPTQARSVALSDARVAPTGILYVRVGRVRCLRVRDAMRASEASAYRWNGAALAGQEWNADHTLTFWRSPRGRVIFDGVCVENRTRAPVLFAFWRE